MLIKYLKSTSNMRLNSSISTVHNCITLTWNMQRLTRSRFASRTFHPGHLITNGLSPNICKNYSSNLLNSSYSKLLRIPSIDQQTIPHRGVLSVQRKTEGYKIHPELENSELYQVISKLPELKETLAPMVHKVNCEKVISDAEFKVILETDYSKADKTEILESFKRLTYYMSDKEDTLSHTSFDNICQALIQSMQQMSDEELCKVLFLLQVWSPKCFRTEKNYFGIFSKVDDILVERINKGNLYYSFEQLLLLLDFWAHINLLRSSNFCKLALKKLLLKSHHLTPKLFVQLLFYHCRYRTFHPLVSAYDIEFNFEKRYPHLSPSEIAIVLLAFFKSEKMFHNPNLCLKVARTFINNVETLPPLLINAYLKSMKHYFPIPHVDVIYHVCNKLEGMIHSCNPRILGNVATLGIKINVYHPKLLDKIIARTIESIDSLRIKDLQRIVYPVSLYNHKLEQPDFFNIVSKEFISGKRQDEVNKHPKCLISLVHDLILANHFDLELIAKCLDFNFLTLAFGKKLTGYVVPKDVLLIDMSVEIEAPSYMGPRLPESLKHTLCKHYAWRKPGELFHNKKISSDDFAIEVQNKLQQILGGEKFLHFCYVLPHCVRPDVLVCIKHGKPVAIPESMTDFVHMNVIPPPAIGTWYAFVFVTHMQMVQIPEERLKGNVAMKIRQLTRLGYKPVIMCPRDWKDITEEGRGQLLRDRLGLD